MKRVLLKLSGEALAGDKKTGFDEATCIGVAEQVKQLEDAGIQVAILFSKDAAVKALEEGKVVFFAGGTGHPYFSTDTGAVLRAIEIEAEAMLVAKTIDGVYDSDPKVNPEAVKYDEISISEVIEKRLAVIDLAASILCMENQMPMLVFGLSEENSIVETMTGTFTGTKVTVS